MPTFSLTLEADRVLADEVASELFDHGAGGVEVRDGEGMPMPGVPLPPTGRAVLVAPQEDEVRRAYAAAGLSPWPGGDRHDGEWSLVAMKGPR